LYVLCIEQLKNWDIFLAGRTFRSNRIKTFSSATSADAQKILRAIGPPSMFPASLGGKVG
jgi:hypothetical protein